MSLQKASVSWSFESDSRSIQPRREVAKLSSLAWLLNLILIDRTCWSIIIEDQPLKILKGFLIKKEETFQSSHLNVLLYESWQVHTLMDQRRLISKLVLLWVIEMRARVRDLEIWLKSAFCKLKKIILNNGNHSTSRGMRIEEQTPKNTKK